MAVFKVNGQSVCPEKNQKLIRFLRDELHLTSVKDGCSEGACGACTVIIDGKTCKACVPDTDSLNGKEIITVEGLTEWEAKVYTYAYGKAGAVQCGKHFLTKIWNLPMMRSDMHCAITIAAVQDM